MPEDEPGPDAALPQPPPWPAPDLCTLRAVGEPPLAPDTDGTVDAAHAVVADLADRAFGHGWQRWYGEALAAEGVDDDPGRLLTRDDLAERVLARLRDGMREDDGAPDPPDPPDEEYGWFAYVPGTNPGRVAFRRVVRHRRENARRALLSPRRPRVAGRRSRGRRRPGRDRRGGGPWVRCPAAGPQPRPCRTARAGRGAPNA